MKKIFSFVSIMALAFSSFVSFAFAGGGATQYVYYADASSTGTVVTCHTYDSAGDYIYCAIDGSDKAFGIAVDSVPARHVQYGNKAFGIAVDEVDSFMYHDGTSMGATSVNCNAIDTSGDYLLCNIGGDDKAFGIAVDTPEGPYIQYGDKAFGIAVDDTDSFTYYANSSSAGETVSCGSLDTAGDYVVCNIGGDDKAFGIAVDTPVGPYVQNDDKAFGIAVDEADTFVYQADAFSAPVNVNCAYVTSTADYMICNINGTDKAFGIAVDAPSSGHPYITANSALWGQEGYIQL